MNDNRGIGTSDQREKSESTKVKIKQNKRPNVQINKLKPFFSLQSLPGDKVKKKRKKKKTKVTSEGEQVCWYKKAVKLYILLFVG